MESLTTITEQPRPHVVLLASPGAGHLIPLAELASRLVELQSFAVTIVTFTNLSSPADLQCIPASVSTAVLPAVEIDDLPANAHSGDVLMELIRRSLPNIRSLVRSINSTAPLAALVPDLFCSTALPIAAELGVPGYLFIPSNLALVALTHHIAELHQGEHRDLAFPLELPGGMSLRSADLPDGCRHSRDHAYARVAECGRHYQLADGLLVNTFYEMEPATVEAFEQLPVVPEQAAAGASFFTPVFPVGPLVRRTDLDKEASSPCLEWLDRQPVGSVVYVSFGSGGALSVEQTAELAAGLEASGQRFLWVVRMPSLDGDRCSGDYDGDPLAWLPAGFLERTSSRGVAVAGWAPQVRVLSHPATAAFVSHCGWNSTLESVQSGVPIVAWPLYAEQRMNAVILEEKLGVALRMPEREDGGLVTRHEIATAVRELVEEGHEVRRLAEDLQKAAARAWSPEGPSRRALEEVAVKWKAALAK